MYNSGTEQKHDSASKKASDLYGIAEDIGRHRIAILLLAAAVWICAFAFLSWRQQETYSSSATASVTSPDYESIPDTYYMLNYAVDAASGMKGIIESSEFRNAVAADLGYPGFKGSLAVTLVGDSNLIRITVTSGDPEISCKEVESVLKICKKYERSLSSGACLTVLEQPVIQQEPHLSSNGKKKALLATLAALAACILAGLVLAGISLCKDDVRDGIDVVNKTGAEFLGAIYRSGKKGAAPDLLITDPKADLPYIEGIRRLAIRIGRRMADRGQKVLLLSSAADGEGKSAAAANLAAALAQGGRKVVLITGNPGSAVEAAGLKIIRREGHPEPEEIEAIIGEQGQKADVVIIDAAPLSESSEAVELAKIADASALIIRRHYTEAPEIRSAVNALGGAGRMPGCIVTDVPGYSAAVSVSECARLGDGGNRKYLVDRGDRSEVEIDLAPFLADLRKEARRYCVPVLAVVLLFGGIFYYVGGREISSGYTAYSTFTVELAGDVVYETLSEKGLTSDLVGKMVPPMLSSDAMKSIVKEDLGYSRSENLPATITASVVTNSNFVRLSVNSADPQLAYDVMQSVLRNSSIITDAAIGKVDIEIIDDSGVPTKRGGSTGNGKKAAAAGVILGSIVCFAALVVKLILRDTILSEDEISWKLKTTVYGRLPWIKNEKKPITIEADDIPNSFAESIREIRCRIEEEAQTSGARTFLVTSAVRSEGKTTAAVNIALALAGHQHRVLLVDGDLRDPSVMKALGMEPAAAGLSDILAGKSTPEQTLVPYRGNKELTILPGGTAVQSPYELWSSAAARKLAEELGGLYDYVIVDAPQSAVVSETGLMAELADACLFVIRRDCAAFDEICEGVETFEESGCRFLGCVMRS